MFTGCGTALVTPFKPDLSLDVAATRRLIQRQIHEGIDFLVPCGTTGESPTLTREEHLQVVLISVEEARKAGRKVPVLAGCGGYNTAEVIELAQGTATPGRRRAALGDSVLQQGHARRFVSPLQSHRGCGAAADHGL